MTMKPYDHLFYFMHHDVRIILTDEAIAAFEEQGQALDLDETRAITGYASSYASPADSDIEQSVLFLEPSAPLKRGLSGIGIPEDCIVRIEALDAE